MLVTIAMCDNTTYVDVVCFGSVNWSQVGNSTSISWLSDVTVNQLILD